MNRIGPNVFVPPMPVALVGAIVEGKPNFMTVGWVTRVNFKPPMMAVVLNKGHYTPKGIMEHGTFSICFPPIAMEELADYCGVVSGRSVDKSKLFDIFYGDTETAPMIMDCPLNIECRLAQTIDLPTNTIYIGEVVESYCKPGCLTDGVPDITKINPLLLTMPDNRYWSIGEMAGRAFKDGLNIKEKLHGK
ncbi:MAG TPA: flavin reductase family protein [Desulfuromonadales bacterium]|nr:flavin reductase family protein [Desulfuromonadales bacterium]